MFRKTCRRLGYALISAAASWNENGMVRRATSKTDDRATDAENIFALLLNFNLKNSPQWISENNNMYYRVRSMPNPHYISKSSAI